MTAGLHPFSNATRATGRMARFVNNVPHADQRAASLGAAHAALVEARTLFPSRVIDASEAPRLLVPGYNSAKIGGRIVKGPWAGLHIFTLTLEERATCPTSCGLWSSCYGNAMPMPRRHRDDGTLIERLGAEINALLRLRVHRRGIAVRLHVLGDFYSAAYARAWLGWMKAYPGLHVFGFTAWQHGTEIGDIVLGANRLRDGRWKIRCSVPSDRPIKAMQATTIWRQPEAANVSEGLVCPASTHKTDCCGTCGVCWSPAATGKRIVFPGHGMKGGRHKATEVAPPTAVQQRIAFAGGAVAVAIGMGFGAQAILRWGKTDRVPQASREAFEALCDDLGQRRTGGSTPMKFGSDKAGRQCESLGVVADEVTFRAAVADIAWSKEHSSDQRAAFLHPDPGSRETWRVMLGGVEVDVLFQPSSNCVLDVSMVRGYAKASAKAAPRALNAPATADYAPKPPVHAPSPAPTIARAIPANAWDWTSARDALLHEMWPSHEPRPEIEKKLRALPGQSGSTAAIATRAIQTLGLKRPAELSNPYHGHAVRETRAQREARMEQRNVIIRDGYAADLDDVDIFAKLKAAHRGPWGGSLLLHDIAPLARALGFKRPVLEPAIAGGVPMPVELPEPPPSAPPALLQTAQLAEVSAEVVEIAAATAEAGDSADASDSTDAMPAPEKSSTPVAEPIGGDHAAALFDAMEKDIRPASAFRDPKWWEWTAARDRVLHLRWPSYMVRAEIEAELSKLPGNVGGTGAIVTRAAFLGLNRPKDFASHHGAATAERARTSKFPTNLINSPADLTKSPSAAGPAVRPPAIPPQTAAASAARAIETASLVDWHKDWDARPAATSAPDAQVRAAEASLEARETASDAPPAPPQPGAAAAPEPAKLLNSDPKLLNSRATAPPERSVQPHVVRVAPVLDDSDASFLRRLVSHEALLVRRLDLVRDLIAAYRETTDLDDAPRAGAT